MSTNAVVEPRLQVHIETIDERVLSTMSEINDMLNQRFDHHHQILLVLRLLGSLRRYT